MVCRLVGAFDFGTTYSGYAFSFYDKPIAVRSNQEWENAPEEVVSMKTATCLLLNPGGEFDKFGYDAEVKYTALANKEEHIGWRLFRQFKMMLHNNKTLSPNTMVEDVNGQPMQALHVFAMSIRYLKGQLLQAVEEIIEPQKGVDMASIEITYVITVPAIWDDRARQFMREAAALAGIDTSRLKLVLEPEAASSWGQSINAEKLALSVAGTQYMVIDLGGGTADISVHEKRIDGTLREVHASTGGPWGGRYVDEGYLNLLRKLFGATALEQLKQNYAGEYLRILNEFETQKRKLTLDTQKPLEFSFSKELFKFCNENSEVVKARIANESSGQIKLKDDKLSVDISIVKQWFDFPLDSLIEHVNNLLGEPELCNIHTILLVGGFGENLYVKQKLKNCIKIDRLLVPDNAGVIVLIGAVRCGHIPNLVSSKVLKQPHSDKHFALFDHVSKS